MENGRRPWWADDPEIAAMRRRVEEELERASREPITPDAPPRPSTFVAVDGFGRQVCCRQVIRLRQNGFHQHYVVGRPQRQVVKQLSARRPRMQERPVDAARKLHRWDDQLLMDPG